MEEVFEWYKELNSKINGIPFLAGNELNINYNPIKFNLTHNNAILSATLLREDIQNKNWSAFKNGYKTMLNDKIISEYKLKKFYKMLMEV